MLSAVLAQHTKSKTHWIQDVITSNPSRRLALAVCGRSSNSHRIDIFDHRTHHVVSIRLLSFSKGLLTNHLSCVDIVREIIRDYRCSRMNASCKV